MRFQNKTILITGASRGIGKSLAHAFAREGANLVLTARTQTDLEKVSADIQHQYGVRVVPVVGDVSDEDHAKAAVEIAVKEFKQIHVLINNAAISGMRPIYGLQKASWEKTLAVNLTGTFLFTKHVWKPMKSQGGGAIINIASTGGQKGFPFLAAYCASKWGQIGFSKTAAEEGKPDNIRVNVVAPGKADTDIRAQVKEDKTKMLTANDCDGVCLFLASDEAKWITGEVIAVEWFAKDDEA